MLPTERLDYSPISERKPLVLPDGARLAVWIIVNVEEWDINETMPRTVLTPPAGGAPMPDIPNWAWHEYGNRVGFWRMLDLFDDFRIPAVLAINGSAITSYGAIVEAARERHWEFIGHGFTQRNMQKVANSATISARPRRRSVRPPAATRAAGLAPVSPRLGRPPTSLPKRATIMSAIGCWMTSRPSRRRARSRSSTSPTRRNATMSR